SESMLAETVDANLRESSRREWPFGISADELSVGTSPIAYRDFRDFGSSFSGWLTGFCRFAIFRNDLSCNAAFCSDLRRTVAYRLRHRGGRCPSSCDNLSRNKPSDKAGMVQFSR